MTETEYLLKSLHESLCLSQKIFNNFNKSIHGDNALLMEVEDFETTIQDLKNQYNEFSKMLEDEHE